MEGRIATRLEGGEGHRKKGRETAERRYGRWRDRRKEGKRKGGMPERREWRGKGREGGLTERRMEEGRVKEGGGAQFCVMFLNVFFMLSR